MADLITSARAKYNINQSSFTSAEDTTIAALVTAVSKAVRRYCRREFDSQSFDELYSGTGDSRLLLRQYPLLSVSRVATRPATVLTVTNDSASNQRATVSVTDTGLSLTRVASGVSSTDTSVTWAANPTLEDVKDAVDALGNGWSAAIPDSTYALWLSDDLRSLQGALNAKDCNAPLCIHVEDVARFSIDPDRGWLFREDPWAEGCDNYRVVYTAGYATVPEDVQEACAQWVAALFWATKDNPAVYPDLPTPGVSLILDLYRCHVL
jgi:hypothetical protein